MEIKKTDAEAEAFAASTETPVVAAPTKSKK